MKDQDIPNHPPEDPPELYASTLLPGNPILEGKLPDHVGKFKIKRILGEGGMGVLGLGVESEGHAEKRRVAVKFLKRHIKGGSFEARLFEQECKSMARFNHDNIARFFDFGYHDGNQRLPYIVMEYIEDAFSITDHCAGERKSGPNAAPLSLRGKLELFLCACSGIRHAHQRSVIHRDIKPSNVLVGLVDGRPVVKIIDFGISIFGEDKDLREGGAAGTPAYMSPEQLDGDPTLVDQRADIYALGILLCELMVGRKPYDFSTAEEAKTALSVMGTQGTTAVVPSRIARELSTAAAKGAADESRPGLWRQLAKELRGDLDAIVAKATAFKADQRYSSVDELVEDIGLYLQGYPLKYAIQPTTAARVVKYLRRNAFASAASAAILLLLAGLTAYGIRDFRKTKASNQAISKLNTELKGTNSKLEDNNRSLWKAKQESYASTLNTFPMLLSQGRQSEARLVLAPNRKSVDKGWEWYHLLASSDQSSLVLGHSDTGFVHVTDAGPSICSVASDYSVWFWKSEDHGKFIRVNAGDPTGKTGHAAAVLACASDGDACYSLDKRGLLIAWRADSGELRDAPLQLDIQDKSTDSDFLLQAAIDAKSARVLVRWQADDGAFIGVFSLKDGKAQCAPLEVPAYGSLCWREDKTIQTAEYHESDQMEGTLYRVLRLAGPGEALATVKESRLRTDTETIAGSPLEMISRGGREFLRFSNGLSIAHWKQDDALLVTGGSMLDVQSFTVSDKGTEGFLTAKGIISRFTCNDEGKLEVLTDGKNGAIGRLTGHNGAISSLTWSGDGRRRLLSASSDGTVRVWNNPALPRASRLLSPWRDTLPRLKQLTGIDQLTHALDLYERFRSPEAGWCRTIKDGQTRGVLAIFDVPPWIMRTCCEEEGAKNMACPPFKGLELPPFLAGEKAVPLSESPHIFGAGASADGRFIAVLRWHDQKNALDIVAGDLLADGKARWTSSAFERSDSVYELIAVSDDARWIAATRATKTGGTGELVLWDFKGGASTPRETVLKPAAAPLGTVRAIEFSSKSGWFAAGNTAGRLFLWKLPSGAITPAETSSADFSGHPDHTSAGANGIRSIAFSHGDEKIAVALDEISPEGSKPRGFGFVRLNEAGASGPVKVPTPSPFQKLSQDICWNFAGTRLASADNDGCLRIWALLRDENESYLAEDYSLVLEINDASRHEETYPLQQVCWSDDARWLAASNTDEGCYVYDGDGSEVSADWKRQRVQLEFDDLMNRVSSIAQIKWSWRDISELQNHQLGEAAVAQAVDRIGVHPDEVTRWAYSALLLMPQLDPEKLSDDQKRTLERTREKYLTALQDGRMSESGPARSNALALAWYRLNNLPNASRELLRRSGQNDPFHALLSALISAREGNASKSETVFKELAENARGASWFPLWQELGSLLEQAQEAAQSRTQK